MSGKAWGSVCAAAGLGLACAGWRLIRSQELPEGATGFSGPGLDARGLRVMLGNALLVFGLILAFIVSSFFFIGG